MLEEYDFGYIVNVKFFNFSIHEMGDVLVCIHVDRWCLPVLFPNRLYQDYVKITAK